MPKAIFNNIESELITYIEKAESSIKIAVTWFTNKNLFNTLLNKLNENVIIDLVLTSDDINFSTQGLDFKSFIANGGKLYIQNSGRLMHHKFCIIDEEVLINGSYNWTQLAETSNNENVIVFENEQNLINEFSEEFSWVANSDGILVNAIPFFKHPPVFTQPVYESIEYVNNDDQIEHENVNESEFIDMNTFRVREIYAMRSFNGVRFIPMCIYCKNGMVRPSVLYFAWETEYDLRVIQALEKEDVFAIGDINGIFVDNRFPDFFWQITGIIENFYWELYRYRNEKRIGIGLFIKKDGTTHDALKNLGFDLNDGKFYIV